MGGGEVNALPDFFFFVLFSSLFSRPQTGSATVQSSFSGSATKTLNVRKKHLYVQHRVFLCKVTLPDFLRLFSFFSFFSLFPLLKHKLISYSIS